MDVDEDRIDVALTEEELREAERLFDVLFARRDRR